MVIYFLLLTSWKEATGKSLVLKMFTLGIVLGRAYFSRASFQHDITAKNVLYRTTDKSIKWLMVRGHYY